MADKFHSGIFSIKAGTTSVSVFIQLVDRTNNDPQTGIAHTDLTSASYCRQGGVRTSITLSALAAVDSAWSAGGWKEIDATNMQGWYRLDVPDAAFASGADFVLIDISDNIVFIQTPLLFSLPTYATVGAAIHDDIIESEGNYTVQQALSIILAAVAGRTTNSGLTFKTPNNNATRITATTDASKNRTAMTLTPSA